MRCRVRDLQFVMAAMCPDLQLAMAAVVSSSGAGSGNGRASGALVGETVTVVVGATEMGGDFRR